MPFDRGNATFRMCHLPKPLPEDALERFAAKAAQGLEFVRDEPQWGWVSGRHLLERRIDEETAILGGYPHLHLRQAERKIPASLLRAECCMAELAQLAESKAERLNRKERKAIKEEITAELLPKMPPQLSGTPFVIDAADSRLYVGAASQKQLDMFLGYFCETQGFEPVPLTPDIISTDLLHVDPDLIPPLNFSPDLPDTSAGGGLGQNFLTWLWYYQEEQGGALPPTQLGSFGLLVDGPLVFVAEESGALESSIRKGMPTLSAEAKAALLVGKKLKRAKLVLARDREEWSVVLDADEFVFRSMRLPEGEALDPGSVFEERITNLYVFQKVFLALFERFVTQFSDRAQVVSFQKKAKQWVQDMQGK